MSRRGGQGEDQLYQKFKLGSQDSHGVLPTFDDVHDGDDDWVREDATRCRAWVSAHGGQASLGPPVKTTVRLGIPCRERRRTWLVLSGGWTQLNTIGDVYEDALSLAQRTARREERWRLPPEVLSALPRVSHEPWLEFMHVMSVQNPDAFMAYMVATSGMLLRLFMEAPLAYASLQSMINRSKRDEWWFPLTEEAFVTSSVAVAMLVRDRCADVARHATALQLDLGDFLSQLFPTFFLPLISLAASLTIFDSFVAEGRKVLVRMCLALVVKHKPALLRTQTKEDFLQQLGAGLAAMKKPGDVRELLKLGFDIYLSRGRHLARAEQSARTAPVARARRPTLPVELFASRTVSISWDGEVLTRELYARISQHFPIVQKSAAPRLVYRLSMDGTLLSTLVERAAPARSHVMVIKTERQVLGVYLPDAPMVSQRYYGKRPFIFTEHDVWHSKADQVVSITTEAIQVGRPEAALFLPNGFAKCFGKECDSFDCPPLLNADGESVLEVELYALHR